MRVVGADLYAHACQLRNLSLGGTFVELGRLPIGTLVNITFGLPTLGQRLSLDAVVQWSSDQGIGVQFEGLRAWEVWVLWRYLESLALAPDMLDDLELDDLEVTGERWRGSGLARRTGPSDAPRIYDRAPTIEDPTQPEYANACPEPVGMLFTCLRS